MKTATITIGEVNFILNLMHDYWELSRKYPMPPFYWQHFDHVYDRLVCEHNRIINPRKVRKNAHPA